MYAEERQQAIAQLVSQRGRSRWPQLAEQFEVTTETVRRDLSTLERIGLVRRVHGGAVPAGALTRASRPGSASATRPTPQAKDRIAAAALALLPAAGAVVLLDAGTHHGPASPRLLPRDHRLDRRHPRGPGRARLAGLPHIELHLLPGRVRPTTHAAVGADTVAALGRAARRRRLRRHQRPQRRPRPDHPRPRRGRHQARDRRLRPPDVVLADSSKVGVETPSASPTLDEHRRARHRRRHRPTSDRRALEQAGHRGRGRMILTLTPNPSIDRTVALDGELVARPGAPRRVRHLPGRRQGREHLPRRGQRRHPHASPCCPPHKDDPFVLELLTAGIDCRPVQPAGDVRVNLTITEPDGTTTKLNSPGADVDARAPRADGPGRCCVRAAERRLGGARRLAARRARPPSSTPSSYAALRERRRPGRRRHQRGARSHALVDALPGVRPRPDEAQRRGARVLHRRRPRRARVRPRRHGRGRPRTSSTAASAPCWPRSAATAPCWSPPTAPGTPPRRPPPSSAPSAPATPASSATSSATSGVSRPADRLALAVAYGSAAAGLPGTTIPSPHTLRPELVGVTARPREGTPHDRPHHHRPGAPRRRLGARTSTTSSVRSPAVVGDAGRATDEDQLVEDAFAREATSATGLPGGIAIPHCRTDRRRRRRPSPSPDSTRRSTSAPRTARPTSRS